MPFRRRCPHSPSCSDGTFAVLWQNSLDGLGTCSRYNRDVHCPGWRDVRSGSKQPFPRPGCLRRYQRHSYHGHFCRPLLHLIRNQAQPRGLERGRERSLAAGPGTATPFIRHGRHRRNQRGCFLGHLKRRIHAQLSLSVVVLHSSDCRRVHTEPWQVAEISFGLSLCQVLPVLTQRRSARPPSSSPSFIVWCFYPRRLGSGSIQKRPSSHPQYSSRPV